MSCVPLCSSTAWLEYIMFTATPDYQLVHFVVCSYACQPEQTMVLYQLYFSCILGPKRALFLLQHATHVL